MRLVVTICWYESERGKKYGMSYYRNPIQPLLNTSQLNCSVANAQKGRLLDPAKNEGITLPRGAGIEGLGLRSRSWLLYQRNKPDLHDTLQHAHAHH